jgi:hypothetical protein
MQNMKVSYGDIVLVASLAYLAIDLVCEWDGFKDCVRPVHKWLLASYCLVFVSRVIHIAGVALANSTGQEHFLVHWRVKGTKNNFMRLLTWCMILPAFVVWTGVGTIWISDVINQSPQCLPDPMHFWFFGIWQVLSYAWVATYVLLGTMAFRFERRLRRAEGDFHQVVDEEGVARWGGSGSRPDGLDSLALLPTTGNGLAPATIQALPGMHRRDGETCCEDDCPICLCSILPGESLRRLGVCGHVFHRSCVDIWLLRSRECPLCKTQVVVTTE